MDCKKLHSDIKNLKSLRNSLRDKIESATETGLGKVAITSAFSEADNLSDTLIEKYSEDLIEQDEKDENHRNSEFVKTLPDKLGIINENTTLDKIEDNLEKYLKNNFDLSSNMLVYVLKQQQEKSPDKLTRIFTNLSLSQDKVGEIMERVKNLETYETKNYIFMLPKDKWNEGRIKLPEGDNQSELDPKFIAPSDLTAILKQPVDYDYSYETDGQMTDDDPSMVYNEKWVGKEIRHFPWTKELLKTNEEFLKPNGFHIPTGEDWIQIYDNLKAKYGDYSIAISTALREDLNLAFSGGVWKGDLEDVGDDGYFWSASELSANYARCLSFNSVDVNPEDWDYRVSANSVRCASESGSFPNP